MIRRSTLLPKQGKHVTRSSAAPPEPRPSKEELEYAVLQANLIKLEAETAEIAERLADRLTERTVSEASHYSNRTIHFSDQVDFMSQKWAIRQLAEMWRQSKEPVEIWFHSPGGDVFSGFALYDYIQDMRADGIHVTTVAIGMAASMGGILLQAGDHRVMTEHSWLMIHEPGGGFAGSSSAIKDRSELLEKIETQANEILVARSKLTVDELLDRSRRRDWWLDSELALEHGFIDEIRRGPGFEPAPVELAKVKPIRREYRLKKVV